MSDFLDELIRCGIIPNPPPNYTSQVIPFPENSEGKLVTIKWNGTNFDVECIEAENEGE